MVTKEEKQNIKLSAQLAREQVKAGLAERQLKKIRKLETAEAKISELRKARFGRSKTGKALKFGSKAFRKVGAPAAKGFFNLAGKSGMAILEAQARASASRPAASSRKKRKREDNGGEGFVGGFDPNFRIA